MIRGGLRPAVALAFVALVLTLAIGALLMFRAGGTTRPDGSGTPGAGGTPSGIATPAGSATPGGSATTGGSATPGGSPVTSPTPSGEATILVGAGDVAECGDQDDEHTADLVAAIPGTVFLAGDNVYPDGSARQYRECYAPSWGQFLDRTRPAPGNHEYQTRGAAGYLDYFGSRATPDGATWYSWDAGDWHVIMLDSDCGAVGGCGTGSPQGEWLATDLAASDARCTLAVWHHPRFSSGDHGNHDFMEPFWQILYTADADLVISGHDHDYERFAPQDPNGKAHAERGIREFVVGTGGAGLRPFKTIRANSEIRDAKTHGVIRLELTSQGYGWNFVPVAGKSFTDSGSGVCH
jgi:3',5'-cyclic AMP phosphodiesterase CpdA